MSIKDKIRDLISLICKEETEYQNLKKKWDVNNQYRFICSNGRVLELNPLHSFTDANLKNNDVIILMSPEKISFSETFKSSYVFVSIIAYS